MTPIANAVLNRLALAPNEAWAESLCPMAERTERGKAFRRMLAKCIRHVKAREGREAVRAMTHELAILGVLPW